MADLGMYKATDKRRGDLARHIVCEGFRWDSFFLFVCREEIERQRDASAYRRLHEAGRTEEARRDLARLAIIRQQREEAARKKEAERKGVCIDFFM